MALLYVGSMLPTPLYPLYERQFGISELLVTAIYASYVVGNITVLLLLGRLSDQVGRRPASLLALAVVLASTACFLVANSYYWLFAARVLNGFAVGLGAGALTAWIAEIEPSGNKERASRLATAGNLAGLAVGPVLAGLLAQYAPWPLRLCYLVYVAMAACLMLLLGRVRDGVSTPVSSLRELSLKPRIGVPKDIRLPFVSPAALAFAVFALGGFYGALAPGLLTHQLHENNVAIVGTVVTLFFGTGALVAALTGQFKHRTSLLICTALLIAGLASLLVCERESSMTWLLIASIVTGSAMALGFRSSLGMVNELAPSGQRAELISAYLLVCYTANSVPVIAIGLLSRIFSVPLLHAEFAALLPFLTVVACFVGMRYSPKS
ncbi:MAG TPA: MFS transporter [Steroidobacteraceae bacterium]|jgi:MFS family permease